MTKWYRYEDTQYAPMADEFGDRHGSGSTRVHLREFEVINETPTGAWLAARRDWRIPTNKTFVKRDANKRWACPTKEEAMESFIARKKRQLGIYLARAESARAAIRAAMGNDIDFSEMIL